jgi:formylmethanofuran dehydrogenase subunit D
MHLLLIAARSLKQGTGLNRGKDSEEYLEAVGTVEMNAADLAILGLGEGAAVVISTAFGRTGARCKSANVPAGMAFMAYGPPTSELMGSETYASGMPDSKHIEVTVRPAAGGESHAG